MLERALKKAISINANKKRSKTVKKVKFFNLTKQTNATASRKGVVSLNQAKKRPNAKPARPPRPNRFAECVSRVVITNERHPFARQILERIKGGGTEVILND